jgi:hypothetical protein
MRVGAYTLGCRGSHGPPIEVKNCCAMRAFSPSILVLSKASAMCRSARLSSTVRSTIRVMPTHRPADRTAWRHAPTARGPEQRQRESGDQAHGFRLRSWW